MSSHSLKDNEEAIESDDVSYQTSSDDVSYVIDIDSAESFKYAQQSYVFQRQSVLTAEDSEMKLLTCRSIPSFHYVKEDEYYPDIFDEKIDETEVFIIDESSPTLVEEYEKNCLKYMQPPIALVKRVLEGGKQLHLSNYRPDTTNLHFIFQALIAMPTSRLTHLDLSNNPFEPDACKALSQLLQQNSSIIYLNLERCGIGPLGAEILAEGIEFSQSLLYLNLENCNLQDRGGVNIVEAVSGNGFLKVLKLGRNSLHVETASAIQKMLKENETLESLYIKWNDLYPEKESSVKIMKGLQKNPFLKYLDMSWNGLCGKKFASALSRVIRLNKSIEILLLTNNYLSNEEIPSICNGISKSQSLSHLDISGNPVTEEDIKQLIDATFASATLHSLYLGKYTYLSEPLYQKAMEFNRISKNKYDDSDGIQFGGKLLPNPPDEVDFKAIIVDRAKFLAMKPKKKKLKRDMGHFMLSLLERPEEYMKEDDFRTLVADFKAKIDEDLVDHFVKEFREKIQIGKRKLKRTPIKKMAEYYLARHPTDPPPPPPPPKVRKPKLEKSKNKSDGKNKTDDKEKKKTKGGKKKK